MPYLTNRIFSTTLIQAVEIFPHSAFHSCFQMDANIERRIWIQSGALFLGRKNLEGGIIAITAAIAKYNINCGSSVNYPPL